MPQTLNLGVLCGRSSRHSKLEARRALASEVNDSNWNLARSPLIVALPILVFGALPLGVVGLGVVGLGVVALNSA